jgi:hypothetical protein
MTPFDTSATEGVDGPGASDNLASMRESLGNEIFLSGFDGDAAATDNQGVAALHHNHVFVVLQEPLVWLFAAAIGRGLK